MRRIAGMVGCLTLVLVAVLGSEAEAHLAGTTKIGGTLVHVASLDCKITVGGVPSPDQNPSALVCTVTVEAIEFLCLNPANQQVSPGKSARRTVLIGTSEFFTENINKKKGTGTATVHFDTDNVVTNEDCVNPNWSVIEDSIVVTSALVNYKTVECATADDCGTFVVVAYEENRECTLPPGFGVDPGEEFPAENTEYNCHLIDRQHLK